MAQSGLTFAKEENRIITKYVPLIAIELVSKESGLKLDKFQQASLESAKNNKFVTKSNETTWQVNIDKNYLGTVKDQLTKLGMQDKISTSFNEKTGSITLSKTVPQQTQMKVTAVSPPKTVETVPAKEAEQTAEQIKINKFLALCRSNETSDNMKAEKAFEEITGNKDPAYKKALKGETKDASGKPATYRERMEMALKWAVKKNPDIKAADEYSELYTKLKKQLGNDVQLDLGAVSKFETLYGSLSNLDLGLDKTKWIGSKIGHTELDVKGWHKEILDLNQSIAAKKAAEGVKAKEKTAGTVKKKTEAKSVAQVEDSLSLRIEEFKALKDKEAKKLVKRLEKIPKEPADRRNEIYESIKRNEELWKKNGFKGYAKDPDAVYLRMVGRILDGYGVPK